MSDHPAFWFALSGLLMTNAAVFTVLLVKVARFLWRESR